MRKALLLHRLPHLRWGSGFVPSRDIDLQQLTAAKKVAHKGSNSLQFTSALQPEKKFSFVRKKSEGVTAKKKVAHRGSNSLQFTRALQPEKKFSFVRKKRR